jgi:uncharacterized paraquat-inducible protein A
MALISCHECGIQISESSQACPICGTPAMERIRQKLKVRLFMAGFAIVVAAICAFDIWLIIHDWLQKASGPLQHQ